MASSESTKTETTTGAVLDLAETLNEIGIAALTNGARTAVGQRLAHQLGVALKSTLLDPFAVANAAVADERGVATVLGSTQTRTSGAAAFVNAVAAHSSLQEDCGPGGFRDGSHPGTYIIASALAAAELTGCTGDRLMRGLIVGYEAASRVGAAVPPAMSKRKFRPVGIIGPFGAAAAAAYIFGADNSQLAAALSIAANLSAGTSQGFVSGSMEPYFHAGFAARNGLLAAQLAVSGASAAPAAMDGPHGFFAVYAGEPGQYAEFTDTHPRLAIEGLGSKKYAACLQNQETLELASELSESLDGRSIVRATLGRPRTSENGTASPGVGAETPYSNMLQRQMSARYSASAALLGRDVTDSLYFQTDDERVAQLAERIDLVENDENEITLSLTLDNGSEVTTRGRRQSILYPTPDETRALFLSRASSVLGSSRAEYALRGIDSLESTTNAAEFVALFGAVESR